MKSYKENRNNFGDSNLPHTFEWLPEDELVHQVLGFFAHGSMLVYPAKYVFVNIVYAKLLEKYFGRSFYESLDDAELLDDSPIVVVYSQIKEVYDKVLAGLGDVDVTKLPSTQSTVDYFRHEFLIDEENECATTKPPPSTPTSAIKESCDQAIKRIKESESKKDTKIPSGGSENANDLC